MVVAASKIDKPKSISEIVLERLRADIISGQFELGEKISENALSEAYGVTKAPIRSAYIRLQTEGLVVIRPQSGTFVFKPDSDALRELCELRIALETEAARLALERDPKGFGHEFCEIVRHMESALDANRHDRYQQLDTELHLMILRRARSHLLANAYRTQVSNAFAALRYRFSKQATHNDNSIAEHRALRDAVLQNDCDTFVQQLRFHISNTMAYYSDYLK